ncbi:MAG TPA: type IV pilus modification protein PilV [Arenicellales bacterium]|nr:type IV pilus modification protein PilV [Arenicellales bacterium]
MRQIHTQQGLSMIEVLVAITILSVGLLGTAALQIQSKRTNLGSVERTFASMLVHDMFERMRANPSQRRVYLAELDKSNYVGQAGGSAPGNCIDNQCTPAQMARWDVWDWEQSLIGAREVSGSANTGGLVLPLACMTGPAGGGEGLYTIAVNWRGRSEIADGGAADPCDADASGRYDGDEGTGTLRRTIVVSSYLND